MRPALTMHPGVADQPVSSDTVGRQTPPTNHLKHVIMVDRVCCFFCLIINRHLLLCSTGQLPNAWQ